MSDAVLSLGRLRPAHEQCIELPIASGYVAQRSMSDPSTSQGTVFPTRATPLPWLLLIVFITLTIAVLVVSRNRLEDERQKTAAALKANDEVHARLKATEVERDKNKESIDALTEENSTLSKRVITLELQLRSKPAEKPRVAPVAEKPKPKGKK